MTETMQRSPLENDPKALQNRLQRLSASPGGPGDLAAVRFVKIHWIFDLQQANPVDFLPAWNSYFLLFGKFFFHWICENPLEKTLDSGPLESWLDFLDWLDFLWK
jgi:hypothetical protein